MRLLFIASLLAAVFPDIAGAGELYLRLDVVGFQNASADITKPEPRLLNSLEMMIRPGVAFHSRARAGNTVLTVGGICRPTDKPDEFIVDFHAVNRVGTGIVVPTETGPGKEIVEKTSSRATIRVKLRQELIVGGFQTKSRDKTNHEMHSSLIMKLSIVERDIDHDDES